MHHISWKYKFWDENACKSLIEDYFPELCYVYDVLPSTIQKVDLCKYLILYIEGGVYVDFDYECLKSIEGLLNSEVVIGLEPKSYASFHQAKFFLGNAFMASTPNHKFFKQLIEFLDESLRGYKLNKSINLYFEVMNTTGPIMLNKFFSKYNFDQIKLLSPEFIAPLTKEEAVLFREFRDNVMKHIKMKDAYAVHHFVGSWLQKK